MHRGRIAIQEYCKHRKFASFVIENGLDYLIPTWEKTVLEIKTGYTSMREEYLNDMDTRKIIDEVWSLASDEQIEQYQDRLQAADKVYFDSTVPVEDCIWGSENEIKYGYSKEQHWWYYHVPIDKGARW
ncbi:hypothetical protein [Leptolyngbya ohadii]|uniref:hypothetical protein n=1 Tax=Leptolyngbya ohadii TaxID=1962290 RepID=UPI000B59D277|nr:hypothetical protein [Leptolyngbya ohadii]